MSSNHLDLRSVWKSLVAGCVCGLSLNARFQRVRLNFQRETRSSQFSSAKRVRLQLNNALVF